jgi:AcrR family transcriptional regulator
METIAAEAGVTKPILYKHFGDRRGLVQALAAGFVDDLLTELARALDQQVGPQQLLVTTIDTYLSFVERDPNVYRFLVQRALADPDAGQTMSGVIGDIGQRVALVLGEQLREAGLDSGAAEPWAFGIVGMVHQAGDWWVERRTMPRARLVEYLSQLLWDGIARAGQVVR